MIIFWTKLVFCLLGLFKNPALKIILFYYSADREHENSVNKSFCTPCMQCTESTCIVNIQYPDKNTEEISLRSLWQGSNYNKKVHSKALWIFPFRQIILKAVLTSSAMKSLKKKQHSKGNWSEFVKLRFLLGLHRMVEISTLFIIYPSIKYLVYKAWKKKNYHAHSAFITNSRPF